MKRGFLIHLCIIAAISLMLSFSILYVTVYAQQQQGLLTVIFIDQRTEGESTLVIFPNGETALIDGGVKKGFRNYVEPVLDSYGIKKIDLVIATHKDTDHLNGINALLGDGKYAVGEVWFSQELKSNTRTAEFYGHIQDNRIPLSYPLKGDQAYFGHGIFWQVMHPAEHKQFKNDNDNSLVNLLEYGDIEILFTGDIQSKAESYLRLYGSHTKLDVDIMNAPHHGAETSSTHAFIQTTSPKLVIYGAHAREDGLDKHDNPDSTVIERYNKQGAVQYQTGRHGNIIIETNGKGCTIILEKSQRMGPCFAGINTVQDSLKQQQSNTGVGGDYAQQQPSNEDVPSAIIPSGVTQPNERQGDTVVETQQQQPNEDVPSNVIPPSERRDLSEDAPISVTPERTENKGQKWLEFLFWVLQIMFFF